MTRKLVGLRRYHRKTALTVLMGGMPPEGRELPGKIVHDRAAFVEELRERNRALLLWSIAIFNSFCLAWSALDYVLAPAHWWFFLALRLTLVGVTSLLVAAVHFPALRHRSLEALWLCAFSYGALIAPTVPLSGGDLNAFVLGYVLILLTIGLLPVWPPAWICSVMAAILAALVTSYVLWPDQLSVHRVTTEGAVLLSAVAVSVTSAVFKFLLLRREHALRTTLASTRSWRQPMNG